LAEQATGKGKGMYPNGDVECLERHGPDGRVVVWGRRSLEMWESHLVILIEIPRSSERELPVLGLFGKY
jgi:hypothetical protein